MNVIALLCTTILLGEVGSAQMAMPSAPQQQQPQQVSRGAASPSSSGGETAALQSVLNQMDTAAANFHSARADFVWDQYQKVVDETDTQKGTIYFKRTKEETRMAAQITYPDRKYVTFADGILRLYQPGINQLTEYSTGGHRAEMDAFLVLGFGGRGHDLLRSFDVHYLGNEVINATRTAKLELIPQQPKVRGMFNRIIIWVDPARAISMQQQFFEPSGDFRLARYNGLKLNAKIPDNLFKIKVTSKTSVVKPQS